MNNLGGSTRSRLVLGIETRPSSAREHNKDIRILGLSVRNRGPVRLIGAAHSDEFSLIWTTVRFGGLFGNNLGKRRPNSASIAMSSTSFMSQTKSIRVSNIEKAKLLHQYAAHNHGEFPTVKQVHPEYPEWKWGTWVPSLLRAYLKNSLDENTKVFMEGSVYWRSRIEQIKQKREGRVGKMPIPEPDEKVKLLHQYAAHNQGEFPRMREVHPEYPEWRWGSWVNKLLQAYLDNGLDENTKAFMEGSVYWRSRIEQRKQKRESRVGKMPIPEHDEKVKLLHEYAENSQGQFPTLSQVHPEYPEWKWGNWVNKLLQAYFKNRLDENTKAFMEDSVYWRSRIEQVKQIRESKVGKMPIPDQYEKAKLLFEYAENNKGQFPRMREVHPEYPEWRWGSWVNQLLQAYFDSKLDEETKVFMEGSVYWRSRIEQVKQIRESRVGKMPIPDQYEKGKLLHEYAAHSQGEFPTYGQVHSEYPEWKWGTWVQDLLQAYLKNSLDEKTKVFMEGSVYWRSRIEQVKQKRESRVGKMPIPEHDEKVKLLHEYAENSQGQFPTLHQVHPEYPEWKWGSWVNQLLQAYFDTKLDENIKAFMEDSVYWRSRIEQVKQIRESKIGKMPIPDDYEKVKLLHEYAENNKGEFPKVGEVYPEYPEWKWGNWVDKLLSRYLSGEINQETIDAMEASPYWRSRITDRIARRRETTWSPPPKPPKPRQARMLHVYAENNGGAFPTADEIHPEFPGWRRSSWVEILVNDYLIDALDYETRNILDRSIHWKAKIQERREELRHIQRRLGVEY